LVAVVVFVVALTAAAAAHRYAVSQDQVARTPSRPLSARVDAAAQAASLEPFNHSFEVTKAIVDAESMMASGDVDGAYFLLLRYAQTVRDDPLFRTTYQQAVAAKWKLDARKAHLQHAREDETGGLDAKDVFR
jgi:hypothetical protein